MKLLESPHSLTVDAIVERLSSDPQKGLDGKEASIRIKKYGPNALEIHHPRSLINIFISQFFNALVWILAVAAGLAFLFQEWLEGIAIVVVIFINAFIGFFMEVQAMKSMEALRKLARTNCRVYRNGSIHQISSSKLVPGDIVYLEAGDMVPADCRLLNSNNLGVSEASLTGESIPITKQTKPILLETPLAERTNLVFKGTMVSRGNANAIVFATGKSTELGHIAQLTQLADKESTPLEKKLSLLSRKLIGLTLFLAAVVLSIGLIQGRDIYLMIETSIALAIAAIPEGLPIVATIALARGMLRLARHKVVVKKLSAVETLGETEVIFTDKTGTLTENQMLPDSLRFEFGSAEIGIEDGKTIFRQEKTAFIQDTFAYEQMLKVSTLCNNATLNCGESDDCIGDPLEVALLSLASGTGIDVVSFQKQYPRIREIPFDSNTKKMGTLHKNGIRPDYLICIKGALEVVLQESDYVLTREGKIQLTDRNIWLEQADNLASKGLRVLGIAYAEIDKPKEDFFHHLVFVGFIGFIDPPRSEIKDAIETCRDAGIRVVMVTGDHPETARNIAYRIGLIDNEYAHVVRGKTLEQINSLSGSELNKLRKTNVFARVTPSQKLDLVSVYQDYGHTVGMIGDGVNDTPALKKSDIGIAMGLRGTEAAKEVADLVLEDDAFTSIVMAIKQGRGIFANIRYFVVYLLSCNLSELLLVALAFFSNLTLPLLPLQILFINMVTDVFPAFALGMNKESSSVMNQPPRSKNTPIVTKEMWIAIVMYSVGITIASLGALLFATYYLKTDAMVANNFAFYTLILAQLWHVFNLPQAGKSFIINEITKNMYVWYAIIISLGIMVIAYLSPVLKEVLSLADFNKGYLLYVVIFSLFPVLFIQVLKRLKVIL